MEIETLSGIKSIRLIDSTEKERLGTFFVCCERQVDGRFKISYQNDKLGCCPFCGRINYPDAKCDCEDYQMLTEEQMLDELQTFEEEEGCRVEIEREAVA